MPGTQSMAAARLTHGERFSRTFWSKTICLLLTCKRHIFRVDALFLINSTTFKLYWQVCTWLVYASGPLQPVMIRGLILASCLPLHCAILSYMHNLSEFSNNNGYTHDHVPAWNEDKEARTAFLCHQICHTDGLHQLRQILRKHGKSLKQRWTHYYILTIIIEWKTYGNGNNTAINTPRKVTKGKRLD